MSTAIEEDTSPSRPSLVPLDKILSMPSLGDFLKDADMETSASERSAIRDVNLSRYCEILACIEDLILDHILHDHSGLPGISRLSHLVPSIGKFFSPLPLKETFMRLDAKRSLAARRFVPPSFNDIRHLLNGAQVTAISKIIKLVTFDGDMTLYADGKDFARDSQLVGLLMGLLERHIHVAIVTAAGYPGNAQRYEQRLSGLLDGFRSSHLPAACLEKFYVLGGECNYLFKYDAASGHLVYIQPEAYQSASIQKWSTAHEPIARLLDVAEMNLRECSEELRLADRVTILRKQLSVGLIPNENVQLSREQLDEFALSTQRRLKNYQHVLNQRRGEKPRQDIPFCAFNGGGDVWVDIGNKLIGVQILQDYFKAQGHETLHVGDQFLSTGNDIATRSASCTIWITSPQETAEVLEELIPMLPMPENPRNEK